MIKFTYIYIINYTLQIFIIHYQLLKISNNFLIFNKLVV